MELTLEYWNELAKQIILISSLLSGFSITVVANLLVSDKDDKITNRILKSATLSAACFLVTLFAMVQVYMLCTPGYPEDIVVKDLFIPRTIGMLAFMVGLFALATMISLSGWTKSKKMGRYTTVIGIVTLLLILVTMTRVSS